MKGVINKKLEGQDNAIEIGSSEFEKDLES